MASLHTATTEAFRRHPESGFDVLWGSALAQFRLSFRDGAAGIVVGIVLVAFSKLRDSANHLLGIGAAREGALGESPVVFGLTHAARFG